MMQETMAAFGGICIYGERKVEDETKGKRDVSSRLGEGESSLATWNSLKHQASHGLVESRMDDSELVTTDLLLPS